MGYGLISALLAVLLLVGGSLACRPATDAAGRADGAAAGSTAATSAGPAGGARPEAVAAAEPSPPPLRQINVPLVSSAATMVPFWVAAEHGLFRRYGLEPELVA